MKNGFMTDKELHPYLEKMRCCAEQMPSAVPFRIEDLLSAEEWEDVTQYGHVTLGQQFKNEVDTGKIKDVHVYSEEKPKQYIHR